MNSSFNSLSVNPSGLNFLRHGEVIEESNSSIIK